MSMCEVMRKAYNENKERWTREARMEGKLEKAVQIVSHLMQIREIDANTALDILDLPAEEREQIKKHL